MPYLTNATEVAQNPELVSSCATALLDMAYRVQVNETPILYPNAGYKVYQKRTELATKVIANPMEYGKRAAVLAEIAYPNIVWDVNVNAGQDLHRYLIDNKFAEWDYTFASGASPTSVGKQIWDALAGVNQGDF